MRWIKWYGVEWINSTARDELSPAERGTFIDFVCLASFPSMLEGQFKISSWKALERKLRTPLAVIENTRDKCIQNQRISVHNEEGEGIIVTILNWNRYQAITKTQGGKSTQTPQVPTKAQTAPPQTEDNPLEVEKARGSMRMDTNFAQAARVYEENIGILTPMIGQELQTIADQYPLEWFSEAIKAACEANVRKLSYIRAILERWQTEGKGDKQKKRNAQTEDILPRDYIAKYGHLTKPLNEEK